MLVEPPIALREYGPSTLEKSASDRGFPRVAWLIAEVA